MAARFPELTDPPPRFLPLPPKLGRPDVFGFAPAEGLYVTFCPATQLVTLRISVPRWLRKSPFNFPLVPLRGVDDLRPRDLAKQLATALAFRISFFGGDLERRFPIQTWAVTRVAYAADLHVLDPLSTISGCRSLKRRHQGRVTTFGDPVSTLQWQSNTLRTQIYSKSLELLSRKVPDADKPGRNRAAELASKVVRFEVSLLRVRALRALWDVSTKVPTLQLMCDPLVCRMVLSMHADRLRIHEAADAPGGASIYERSRQVRARLEHEIAAPSGQLPRTKRLTKARARMLASVYFLACGHRAAEIAGFLGLSPSAVSAALRDLEALGLAPDGSDAGNLGHAAREVLEQLQPHLLDERPSCAHWKGRTVLVDPPWADDLDAEDDGEEDDGLSCNEALEGVMDHDAEQELRALLLP